MLIGISNDQTCRITFSVSDIRKIFRYYCVFLCVTVKKFPTVLIKTSDSVSDF